MSDNTWYENGGPPPQGLIVEGFVLSDTAHQKWTRGCVLNKAISPNYGICLIFKDAASNDLHIINSFSHFRPIKTDRELAIEEMLALDCLPQKGMLSRNDFCGALYDAGYRKNES